MAGWENDVAVCKNLNFDETAAKPHLGVINAAGKIPIGTGNTFPSPEILGGSLISPDGSISIGYDSPDITLQVSGSVVTSVVGQSALVAPAVTVTTVGSVSTVEDRTWTSQYVVDANTTVGLRGTFTTIQSAINQAVTDGESTSSRIATIWIRPGTYAENLVMPGSGICLKALVPNGAYTNQTQEVIISGNMTFSALAISIFENLSIAPSITITGTETKVNFINCLLSVTNISGGSPNFYNCNWINSVLTSGGTPNFYECNLTANISISAGTATFQDCNVSPITLSSTGTAICFSCYFPNGGSALSGSSSSTQQLYNCGFSSDQAIACTANVQYSGLWSTAVSSRNFFTTAPTPLLDNCTQGNILQFRKTAVSDTVLKTDYYIGVTNTAAARTITLPTTGITALEPSRGQVFIIKDESNAASINNITITPNGGTIDGAASKVIAVNGGSYQIFFDGTNYFTLPQLGNSFVPTTSWTPVLNFGGATTGITYSSQIGTYSRIGNMVTIFCEIVLTSKGSATGSATITGFPLTSSQTFPFAFRVQNLSFTSIPMFRITVSTISAEQVASAGALSALTDASFTNTSLIQLTATILV